MKIYKDAVTGDEMFTDSYKMKLIDDVLYEVQGKYETRKEGQIVLEGANASQEGEDADDGADETSVSGIDIVLNHRLVDAPYLQDKKAFTGYIKDYMKALIKRVESEKPDEVDKLKKNLQECVKKIMTRFDDLCFYTGESMNGADGMVAMCEYREENGQSIPYLMFFKHGLIEEKL